MVIGSVTAAACACGGVIIARYPTDGRSIRLAVNAHNKTDRHRAWRETMMRSAL